MKSSTVDYYSRRAPEYEAIYRREDLISQRELKLISDEIRHLFAGRSVLEVGCGTGYWTRIAAETAKSILAIDLSEEMLTEARKSLYHQKNIEFQLADAYDLSHLSGEFNAGLANFWLSHVPVERLETFLQAFHSRLERSAVVFMTDNMHVPGFGGERIRKSGSGDTYKLRTLADGSEHEVIKNYFTEKELHNLFQPLAQDLTVSIGERYWWLSYRKSDATGQ